MSGGRPTAKLPVSSQQDTTEGQLRYPNQMRLAIAAASIILLASASFAQIHPGLTCNFQDGTNMGWEGPNVFNAGSGGPNGTGDRYLTVTADGSGQGGKLATYNTSGWIGNYQSAGVTSISMMLKNFNAVPLEMRIVLFDGVTHARWTSTKPATIAPNSGWTFATFSLAESDLTRVQGTSDYQGVITNVERLMIRHDASNPSAGGTNISGDLGIDNVQAVPEPVSLVSLAIGSLVLAKRRRSRR